MMSDKTVQHVDELSLSHSKVLVVMPTYNEIDNLRTTISGIFSSTRDAEVLVVDDNSPDGTGRMADFIAQGEPRLHVLHRQAKNGLGPAYLEGFHWALDRRYDVICEMDMDGSHRPLDLARMLDVMERNPHVDLVIGSRRVKGGQTVNWPLLRDVISRSGSWYARRMLGLPVKDVTAGFRAYRSDLLRGIDLDGIEANGYVFQVDMTRRAHQAGARILEIPIAFIERTHGNSKMGSGIVLEAMMRVTVWGAERMMKRS
ncbi:MAG: polyprenol monophosphomannose synthase [Bifidobacterium crudilactis]|jgi:dolichol-phosphate mannosyltransferase|nr:polyprenol monophosphomannose synthase [Bifidobacterium crudilactis]MCI1217344.1 polyprenol monophosphomannose synthase [Bifidobacterium crudilactis]MCI1637594.1 polyprenol monophosphomannose synthase [Bifidobacterium crudilactis]